MTRSTAIHLGNRTLHLDSAWQNDMRRCLDDRGDLVAIITRSVSCYKPTGGIVVCYRVALFDKLHSAKLKRIGDAIAWLTESYSEHAPAYYGDGQ